jgi:hypothetical protein
VPEEFAAPAVDDWFPSNGLTKDMLPVPTWLSCAIVNVTLPLLLVRVAVPLGFIVTVANWPFGRFTVTLLPEGEVVTVPIELVPTALEADDGPPTSGASSERLPAPTCFNWAVVNVTVPLLLVRVKVPLGLVVTVANWPFGSFTVTLLPEGEVVTVPPVAEFNGGVLFTPFGPGCAVPLAIVAAVVGGVPPLLAVVTDAPACCPELVPAVLAPEVV